MRKIALLFTALALTGCASQPPFRKSAADKEGYSVKASDRKEIFDIYAALPLILKSSLSAASVLAGMSPDSFSFQNPLATNPGYFMNPADGVFLYSIASFCEAPPW